MAALRRRRSRPDASSREHESLEERLDRELIDVPAAVVCALCDDPDCTGCEHEQSRSGVVAIIAWERPLAPVMTRLWSTARMTTRDAESFFEALPDGPVMPALRFAAICELLAASSMLALLIPVAAVVAPGWLTHVVMDPAARSLALRVIVAGLPGFAALLVLAHAAHGLSIDRGATKQGAQSRKARALRFGLYACGWDLVGGPLGAILVAIKEGVRFAADALHAGTSVPGIASRAFIRGCYRLEGRAATLALRSAWVGAAVATIFAALLIFAALIALVLV